MAQTLFFYDLETTGVDPRRSRIMQFAGQRTDLNFKPIGEPYNILIRLTDDILPDPDAVILTGITPQKTLEEGISEAEFCELFEQEISKPGTCFLGYNSIRFDDEFMRFLLYRNFHDPYSWQWKDDRSRWDLLDVVRMTRALRPGEIKWPFDDEGRCTNRLELLTQENGLLHDAAHDALSDVKATIAVASMIKASQPKLYDYLFSIRSKRDVMAMVAKTPAFVYSSGRYPGKYEKTTVVCNLGPHPGKQAILVYDLRHDPTPYLKMDVPKLAEEWRYVKDREKIRLPVKAMQFNRAPAIAPLSVLDKDSAERLEIDTEKIKKHHAMLEGNTEFYEKIRDTVDYMNKLRGDESVLFNELESPDEQLYEKFISDTDRAIAAKITSAKPDEISGIGEKFKDKRLVDMLPLYKARNFPKFLTAEERNAWEEHRKHVMISGGPESRLARFSKRLAELSQEHPDDKEKQYLVEELRLYAESVVPEI